jgi:hypothetical protein
LLQLEEQAEVEAGLVAAGRLLPEFRAQQRYWLGLRALLPSWQRVWIDPQVAPYGDVRTAPLLLPGCAPMLQSCLGMGASELRCASLQAASYAHWGADEPDNSTGTEVCTAANYTQAYDEAWGWSDTGCNQGLPFMCRLLGE